MGGAAAPAQPGGGVPIPLGFDTYSLNRSGWKALEYLDYAASQKLDTIQFSSLSNYESLDPAYLQKVKDSAARLGLLVEGGMDSICPTSASFRKNAGRRGEPGAPGPQRVQGHRRHGHALLPRDGG